jgi:hypothetical protein
MRRALCVGIDAYDFGELRGCVSDATRLAAVLERDEDGRPNFECRTLVAPLGGGDKVVTTEILREKLNELFRDPAELALLHFSGHGTVNDLGGCVVTQDAQNYAAGVQMRDILDLANTSKADQVVITLDCCHSGHLGSVPGVIANNQAVLREGVSILTASRGDQPSVEVDGGGLFTSLVIDALEGGAADILGAVTAPAIYAFADAALGAWDSRPLLKSHVSRLIPIRRCTPTVDLRVLRRLPVLFPLPAEEKALDPSYEHTSKTVNAAHAAIFGELQMLCSHHLVEPCSGTNHMYDAAMQSKACRLTPTGRYYWRLAKSNRL